MILFARWIKDKEGGKCPLSGYDMAVLRIAERYHISPEAAENMDEYWFNRTLILIEAENKAHKMN